MRYFRLIILSLFLIACKINFAQKVFYGEEVLNWKQKLPPSDKSLIHSVFLIGDVKYPSVDSTVILLLKEKLDNSPDESSLLVLGDIVYPRGLPAEDSDDYPAAKADMDAILTSLKDYNGKVVFIPGNHDWQRGQKEGWERIKTQQAYIRSFLHNDSTYLPHDGCPGPVEIKLSNDIVAIIFDSQWWFHRNEKPGPEDGCGFEDEAGLFIQVEDIIRRNKGRKIIFAAHHPLFSVGYHGGYFPAEWSLFPFLERNKYLYIPFPGFIYTGYRKYMGHIQDIAHPEYAIFKESLLDVFDDYPNIIYAAGHEHNLQYFSEKGLHQVISGGGGEGTYISKRKKKTDFAMDSRGFSMLNFYKNGDAWVEYWIPDGSKEGELVFRSKLFNQENYKSSTKERALPRPDLSDSTISVKLTDIYNKGGFVRFWMGDNYRETWNTKVELPVFDIMAEKGGLEILKRGGGQQTRSVRMQDKNGRQYVLRSVNKYVEKAIGKELRNTIAEDAVQDAISASNPYASLTVPKMADAAGIMHTNPKIVWVPDDPALGIYRKDLANNIFLFEERPAGDRSDVDSFGNSTKIVNTLKVLEKTEKNHDYQVDQLAVLRARLFDIYLNDWDRHDDQWRWARFKDKEQTTYKPIPRDRDQVYFVNQGVIMWLASQDFIMPKFQGFDYEIKNIKGLGFNARYFDRTFISEPKLETWIETAKSIQQGLTDDIIHDAVSDLPKEIYENSGTDIEAKLLARRDKLDQYAEEYYQFLAREVDVVGTHNRDLFRVNRLENGNTDITVFALSKKKGKVREQLYHREFKLKETREIRLYGLDGKDKFEIDGEASKAIKIRLIGGKNNDSVIDNSNIKRGGKSLLVYDRKDKKNSIIKGKETKLKLSSDKSVDDYNRKQYRYDKTMPLINAGFNIDDGFFIGGGVSISHYNFRDSTKHNISGTLAFETGAFSLDYKGLYSAFSQFFDLEITASVSMPRNVDNYFGLGNETVRITDDKSFYRVRYEYAYLNPVLKHSVSKDLSYKFGVHYQYFKVQDTAGRFIAKPEISYLDSIAYSRHHFTGINAGVEIDTRNNKVLPERGIHWVTNATGFYGLNERAKNFVRLNSDMKLFLSFRSDPRVVFAFRFGGAMNFGDYEFYHANTLGGKTNLRGFQSRRFAGDHSIYQSTEIRLKVFNLNNYIFNGQTGLYIFNDIGRVWYENEPSNRWHDGYGVGLWISPFNFTALTLSYNRSYEDDMIVFNFKFLF